ncbi:MAG: AbrB/MazE/SpoVT family DNA-binding domain-containing protein [Nanoarchaeota archaeon]
MIYVDVAITRMSSRGQIVIPLEMRDDIAEGEKLVIMKHDKQIIMKKVSDMDESLKDDLVFAKRTEEAFKRHERGLFKEMEAEAFLKELKKW